MRRFTLASAAAAMALTIAIPMSAAAGPAEPIDRSDVSDHVEPLRLECGVRATDAGPVVGCRWTAPTSPHAAGIKLFRLDPATDQHRQVIFRTRDLEVTTYTDNQVRAGHRYAYAVQAVDEHGRVVGQSRAEWVEVPKGDEVEALRLACALGPAHEAIGCEWSRPQHRAAHVVTLWRSVDGGAREQIERFRPAGPNAYRDPVPAGVSKVTYAVIVTSEDGRIVGRSRAETVRVPDTPPVDVRPVDTAPVGARPAPVPPTDEVATDAQATDGSFDGGALAAPADARPSVGAPSVSPRRGVGRLSAELRADIIRLIRELAAL